MITVYKYPIQVDDEQKLEIHGGFIPLTVQLQDGEPFLWVQVDTGKPKQNVVVRTYGTGHAIDMAKNPTYIGSYLSQGGVFVFHVYIEYASLTVDYLLSIGFEKKQLKFFPYDVEKWLESYVFENFVIHRNQVTGNFEFHGVQENQSAPYDSKIISSIEELQELYTRGTKRNLNI